MRSVILFHGLQKEPSPFTVTREEFIRILQAVQDNGFRFAPLTEVLSSSPTDKVVALTFDGGFSSVHEAAEILSGLGAPATVFAVTQYVGKTNQWPSLENESPMQDLLTWDELRTLRSAGWEIQVQTHSHADLRQLPDTQILKELERSKAALKEHLGVPATGMAYPYGYVNRRVYAIVRRHFDYAVTTMLSGLPDRVDPHLVPRIDARFIWQMPIHHYFGQARFIAYLRARQQLRRWLSHPAEPQIDGLVA